VLISHGATAYMIIRDSTDGIRDEQYLLCDKDEYSWPEESIPLNHLARLKQRAEVVNMLYRENKRYSYQRAIILHVDSRTVGKRIDVFFYHYAKSVPGKKLADALQQSLKQKYATHQPNRGYNGTVSPRDELYMINKTLPPVVYIELGNIQNSLDQIRLIKPGNRQALANWLAEGMIDDYKEHNH
jgi:N-acetylmuramoyl-L-alanine amidase